MAKLISRSGDLNPTISLSLSFPASTEAQTWYGFIPFKDLSFDTTPDSPALVNHVVGVDFGSTTGAIPGVRVRQMVDCGMTNANPRKAAHVGVAVEIELDDDAAEMVNVPLIIHCAPLASDAAAVEDITLPTVTTNTTDWTVKDSNGGTVLSYWRPVAAGGGGAGDVTGATNLGSSPEKIGLYKQKVDSLLEFYSLLLDPMLAGSVIANELNLSLNFTEGVKAPGKRLAVASDGETLAYVSQADAGGLPAPALTYGPPTEGDIGEYYVDAGLAIFVKTNAGWKQTTVASGTALPAAEDFELGVRFDGYKFDKTYSDGRVRGFYWDADLTVDGAWVTRDVFRLELTRHTYSGGEVAGATADLCRGSVSVDRTEYDGVFIEGFGATADVGGSPSALAYIGLELLGEDTTLASLVFSTAGDGVSKYAKVGQPCGVSYYVAMNAVEVGSGSGTLDNILAFVDCRLMIGGTWDDVPVDPEDPNNEGPAPGGGLWCFGTQNTNYAYASDDVTQTGSDVEWFENTTPGSDYLAEPGKAGLWYEAEFVTEGTSNEIIYPNPHLLPTGSTVTGIQVEVKRQNLSLGCQDEELYVKDAAVRLLLGGVQIGAPKADAAAWRTSSPETKVYGGSTDLWNYLTTLTDAEVNGDGLAVGIVVDGKPDCLGMGAMGNIYHVRWRIFYSWECPEITNFAVPASVEGYSETYGCDGTWFVPEETIPDNSRGFNVALVAYTDSKCIPTLRFRNFGFEDLPDTAIISGLIIELMRSGAVGNSAETIIDRRLYTKSLKLVGPASPRELGSETDLWYEWNQTFTSSADGEGGPFPGFGGPYNDTPWEIVYVGAPNDNLLVTGNALTPAELKDENFGFDLDVYPYYARNGGPWDVSYSGTTIYAYVYRARIRVCYVMPE